VRLHACYRSSTSYRARIALNVKGREYEIVPVDLLRAEQRAEAFRAAHPDNQPDSPEIGGGQ
jgi:glutathione S-transferase